MTLQDILIALLCVIAASLWCKIRALEILHEQDMRRLDWWNVSLEERKKDTDATIEERKRILDDQQP